MSSDVGMWATAVSLFVAGLAGSLHCVGMCGPILLSLSGAFERGAPRPRATVTWDFAAYHAGRIWTYGLLGFVAGRVGEGLRHGAAVFGWQRPAAIAIAAGVLVGGLVLLGVLPAGISDRVLTDCGSRTLGRWGWFQALVAGRNRLSRLLLGAAMGLLPCGLVWAMLPVVAALPNPLASALGMIAFGAGTVPSLSAVLLVGRAWPAALRIQGTRIVGATLAIAGAFMLARALLVDPVACHPPAGSPPVASALHGE